MISPRQKRLFTLITEELVSRIANEMLEDTETPQSQELIKSVLETLMDRQDHSVNHLTRFLELIYDYHPERMLAEGMIWDSLHPVPRAPSRPVTRKQNVK